MTKQITSVLPKSNTTLKTIKYSAIVLALAGTASNAAIISLSFWGYDRYAGSTPYYTHYQVSADTPEPAIASIDLYDSGWGNTPGGKSAYHYMSLIEDAYNNTGLARSIGWHHYELVFNDLTMAASLLVDGSTIRQGTYARIPTHFLVVFHNSYGSIQEAVIDDFEYRLNGALVYQQGFESSTLDAGWSITRLDAGTYISSGDPTTPHTGSGALALGASTGGQRANIISFDLTSVPEPSSIILSLFAGGCVFLRRSRNR